VANPNTANLETTLFNTIKAGFNKPYVFADTTVERPVLKRGDFFFQSRCRDFGTTPNILFGLREMLLHQPGAQAFGIMTSDVQFMPKAQIRLFLERNLWPSEDTAFIVLNACTDKPGWQQLTPEFWPEQACYIFPKHILEELLEDEHIRKLERKKNHVLGNAFFNWAGRTKRRIFCTSPHVATTVGEASSNNYLGDIVDPVV